MDLVFEPIKGEKFTMEIGYFDTVLEIKEKIEKYHGIPVSKQVLIFNGQDLPDDLNVHYSNILDQSTLQLHIDKSIQLPNKLKITLKNPTSKQDSILEMESNDTIGCLKQRIHETEGVPINRLALQTNGHELNDNSLLRNYKTLSENIEIEMIICPSPASSSSPPVSQNIDDKNVSKKLKIMVLTMHKTKEIPVEVNASDKVRVLKNELSNLQTEFNFDLPSEGYFFIYNQRVMDEDQSFRWHQVNQSDSIEIFGGTVTQES